MKPSRFLPIIILISFFVLQALCSCYVPSPLYGTWADNAGNKIVFQSDGTFTARVYTGTDANGDPTATNFSGTYTVLDNILIFQFESGSSRITDWDINGAALTLKWSEDTSGTLSLTLYHTAR